MKISSMDVVRRGCARLAVAALASGTLLSATPAVAGDPALLSQLKSISTVASTVPGNGDVNPYGVALVRRTTGNLRAGHVLVSNFNNSGNFQGTGTTIVDVAPDGTVSLFAALTPGSLHGACPGGVGLTTALVALEQGWVIVGSLPTAVVNDSTTTFTGPGCLIVLDSLGNPVETFYGSLINGPWDMAAFDGEHEAKLFVTNVLNGTVAANGSVVNGGTVTRLDLKVSDSAKPVLESITVIGSGFPERTDPAALVIGPTGVGLHANCASDGDDCGDQDSDHDGARLYVADTLNNRIAIIDHPLHRTTSAGTGHTLTSGGSLNAPLGLIVVPGGDVLTVNGGDGNILEFSPGGAQRGKELIDSSGSPPGAGALFGLAFDASHGIYYVDDATNTLNLLH